MELWTPTGNVAQTEIYVKIETLNYEVWCKQQLLEDYEGYAASLRKEIATAKKQIQILREKNIKAVSLSEFHKIQSILKTNSYKLEEVEEHILKVKNYIQAASEEIDKLSQEYKKHETAILEFDSEKRRS